MTPNTDAGASIRAQLVPDELQLRTLSDVTLTESTDRSGSIQFGPGLTWPGAWWAGTGWPGTSGTAPGFEMMEDARSVYDLVRRAQGGLLEAPRSSID